MSLFNDRQDEDYDSNADDDMTICVDYYGERIPSLLKGSVVVFVTLEDIQIYIIIVYCCTPIEDVFPPFWMSLLCMVIEVNPLL